MKRVNAIVRFNENNLAKLLNFRNNNVEILRMAYEFETNSILIGLRSEELPENEESCVVPFGNFETFTDDEGFTKVTKLIVCGKEIDCQASEGEVAINE